MSISAQQSPDPSGSHYLLRPEDVAAHEFPVAMRGYDKDVVRRRLRRVSESYAAVLRQRDQARATADEAVERAAAVEGEVQTSARQLAQIAKRCAQLETDLDQARARVTELESLSDDQGSFRPASVVEPDRADLDRALERVAELEADLAQTRQAHLDDAHRETAAPPHADAGELVVAALRVADGLRAAAREEARLALKKARERSAEIARDAEAQARRAAEAAAEAERLQAAAAAATAELERARAAQAAVEQEAAAQRTSLRAEIEQLRAAAATATQELEHAHTAHAAAEQETEAFRAIVQVEMDELRTAAAAASGELERARAAQLEAEQETATVRADVQAEMDELRAAAAAATDELDRARAAQAEAERETEELRSMAREEVEHTVASLEAQRERVQAVLGNALEDALAALRSGDGGPRSILEDLESRLSLGEGADDGSDNPAPEPEASL